MADVPLGADQATWKAVHTLTESRAPIHCVSFSSQLGKYLLTGSQDRKIRLYNVTSGDLIQTYNDHGYEVLCVQPSHDNTRLASCGGDRSVFLWDVTAAKTIKKFSGHQGRVNSVSFNQDSTILASGSFDTTLRIWDLKAQHSMPIQVFDDARDSISCVLIHGPHIFTGSVDGNVRWYDLRKGVMSTDFFEAPVTSINVTKDGQTLIASTLDSTIRKIDLKDGTFLQRLTGHTNIKYRAQHALTPKENLLVAADENDNIATWDLNNTSSELVAQLTPVEKPADVSSRTGFLWTAAHPVSSQQMIATGNSDGRAQIWTRT